MSAGGMDVNDLAFDISAYQHGPTPRWFEQMKGRGFRMAIIQAWGGGPMRTGPNPYARSQLQNARAAGLDLAVYVWLPPDDTEQTEDLIASALGPVMNFDLRFVSMDIEGDRLHPTDPEARLDNAIHYTGLLLPGLPINIYTSAAMWPRVMGNSTKYAHYPLWHAAYIGEGKEWPTELPPVNYGGWTEAAAWQFAGTTPINGVGVDLNIVNYDRLGIGSTVPEPEPGPFPEEDDMPIELAAPIVGMAANPSGPGYWLVGADGGIFCFGGAQFHGSAKDVDLIEPIVGMASTPTGLGYWLVSGDGGVFAYGDATYSGSILDPTP